MRHFASSGFFAGMVAGLLAQVSCSKKIAKKGAANGVASWAFPKPAVYACKRMCSAGSWGRVVSNRGMTWDSRVQGAGTAMFEWIRSRDSRLRLISQEFPAHGSHRGLQHRLKHLLRRAPVRRYQPVMDRDVEGASRHDWGREIRNLQTQARIAELLVLEDF